MPDPANAPAPDFGKSVVRPPIAEDHLTDHPLAHDELERRMNTRQPTLVEEFWQFLRFNKKWWLLPILVAILLLGTLVALSGTALAPFVYPF